MRTLSEWFKDYAVSHQNKTNIAIHYVCVPAIFFSIVGILMCLPNAFLKKYIAFNNPFIENWAFVVLAFLLVFYARLSIKVALQMLIFSAFCVGFNYFIGKYVSLLFFSLIIFVIAWIGQFYGHKIEGKKPSFLKDLQFLLIGPAWVIHKVSTKNNKS